jgi:hypothetical protein
LLSAQVCNHHKSHNLQATTESLLPRSYSCCWITSTSGFELYAKMLAPRKWTTKDRERIKSIVH